MSQYLSHLLERERELRAERSPALVIRQLRTDGGLLEAFICEPGKITNLGPRHQRLVEALQQFLKGKDTELQLRVGPHILDPSEVFEGTDHATFWEHHSVENALRSYGVPDSVTDSILSFAEIGTTREPSKLGSRSLRRLAILASLFARSRVLVLDDPFKDEDAKWAGALAELLVGATKAGERIVLLLRSGELPKQVQAHVETSETEGSVRSLLFESESGNVSEYIVTRPQRIRFKSKPKEGLASEKIYNPEIQPEPAAPTVESASTTKAKPKGTLTSVTMADRIRYSLRTDAENKKQVEAGVLPREVHLSVVRTQYRIKRLALLLLVGIALLGVRFLLF